MTGGIDDSLHEKIEKYADKAGEKVVDIHEKRLESSVPDGVEVESQADKDEITEGIEEAVVACYDEIDLDFRELLACCCFGACRLFGAKLVGVDDVAEYHDIEAHVILRNWGDCMIKTLKVTDFEVNPEEIVSSKGCTLDTEGNVSERIAYTNMESIHTRG